MKGDYIVKKNKNLSILLLIVLILTGCKQNPEDVKLKSEFEIKNYALKEFGKATFIETVETENDITCYFVDEELGFQYYITSYVGVINKFPTVGGIWGYEERVTSNYANEYLNVILNKALSEFKQEENRDCIRLETENIVKTWKNINVFINDKENVEEVIKKYGKLVKKYDSKKMIESDSYMTVYSEREGEEVYEGIFYLERQEYMSGEEEHEIMKKRILKEMMEKFDKKGDAKFIREEVIKKWDEEISNWEILPDYEKYSENKEHCLAGTTIGVDITVYYYELNGKEFYIVPHCNMNHYYEDGGYYTTYYTNIFEIN